MDFLHRCKRFYTSVSYKSILIIFLHFNFLGIEAKEKSNLQPIKIAFGSCMDQDLEKQIWKSVLNTNPNVWLWLGDNIYKDTYDKQEKELAYAKQKQEPLYSLLRTKTKVLGVWDDHDFGINDSGMEYPKKEMSRDLFFQFLDINPKNHALPKEGIYQKWILQERNLKVRFFLLDTRTFRTALKKGYWDSIQREGYIEDDSPETDMLGKEQWSWLEANIKPEGEDLNIIVSSIQVLNDTHPFEKWSNFPKQRKKLLNLIAKHIPKNTILLSGDRHIAEIFEERGEKGNLYIDFTSSSLNKPIKGLYQETQDERRKSKVISQENFGLIEVRKQKRKLHISLKIIGLEDVLEERAYLRLVGDTGIEPATSTMSR
ncbi:hypothetical protein LPTSP4_13490 [Leptospira ryugenii]|uniref:PhoD-like phosphatase metallophosphatase domain-containing protein n=1 Tax=Leptospira ryugenii TaxID=1917863 RepID=A0A2P2DYX2_9LEPT|nr:hypothetical protein LPTSP4_13490 [Leptospira ryugenii]